MRGLVRRNFDEDKVEANFMHPNFSKFDKLQDTVFNKGNTLKDYVKGCEPITSGFLQDRKINIKDDSIKPALFKCVNKMESIIYKGENCYEP